MSEFKTDIAQVQRDRILAEAEMVRNYGLALEEIKDQQRTMDRMQARIEALEAQQRWVSVSERLPDDGGVYYVIKRGDREPTQSLFDKKFGTFMGPVLYWIGFSLPEPPEAEK